MKLFIALITALILISFSNSSILASKEDIHFISSKVELHHAVLHTLEKKDSLQGIAISINFYRNSDSRVKSDIEGLIMHVRFSSKPIFLYGQPFNNKLAKRLLVEEDGSGCRPTVWAGVFQSRLNGRLSTVKVCGADDVHRGEQQLRKQILEYWEFTKVTLRAQGYKIN